MKSEFDQYKAIQHPKVPSDLECFIGLLSSKLSSKALQVVGQAIIRNQRYEALLARMKRSAFKRKQYTAGKRLADLEAAMIKGVVDFELATNREDTWTFRNSLAQLTDDFLLLREYIGRYQDPQVTHLCDRWGDFVLTDHDKEELNQTTETERAQRRLLKLTPYFQPVWFFFVALCHALQEGENNLTALDACWLGLIDEVIGESVPPPLRLLLEYKPDPVPPPTGD